METGIRREGVHEVCSVIGDIRLLVLVRDLPELGPGPAVCQDKHGFSLEGAAEGGLNALDDVWGVSS